MAEMFERMAMVWRLIDSGDLVLTLFSALAQFERQLIQKRTYAGLAAPAALDPGRQTPLSIWITPWRTSLPTFPPRV